MSDILMSETHQTPASEIGKIIDAVGAGCNPYNAGPTVVRINLKDGRTIKASYYRGPKIGKKADIFHPNGNIIWDSSLIRSHVESLLSEGKSFVTETGSHDEVCTLLWEIHK